MGNILFKTIKLSDDSIFTCLRLFIQSKVVVPGGRSVIDWFCVTGSGGSEKLVFSTPSISLIYVKYLYSLRNMRDTSDILDQLRGMRYELKERYHIRSIGIFGSYSRKHQTEQSDLDLVVEFDQPIGMMAFVHLKDLISDRLNIKVDLVTPEGLHPLIRDQVMHEVVYV